MNGNRTRAPSALASRTRFEQFAPPPAPFRATRENEFEQLKKRLLAQQLTDASAAGLNTPLRRAANEAAALAWVTSYPLLVFPALFEEKTANAVRQAERQARIFKDSHKLLVV